MRYDILFFYGRCISTLYVYKIHFSEIENKKLSFFIFNIKEPSGSLGLRL